jgi:hypothetical protein
MPIIISVTLALQQCLVILSFSSKSWNGQQKLSVSLSLEQADKKSSGSPNEVDTFKVKSQLLYLATENSLLQLN